jgi:ferrous iron transport protein A
MNIMPKKRYRITSMTGLEPGFSLQLRALGLLPGVIFDVVRQAPLGGPFQLEVRGFTLSLRRDDLQKLALEQVD